MFVRKPIENCPFIDSFWFETQPVGYNKEVHIMKQFG